MILHPRAYHKLIKLLLISVFEVDERVHEVLRGAVNRVLSAEFVEQVQVELVVVLSHKSILRYVLEFSRNQTDVLHRCALSCHL